MAASRIGDAGTRLQVVHRVWIKNLKPGRFNGSRDTLLAKSDDSHNRIELRQTSHQTFGLNLFELHFLSQILPLQEIST